MNERVAIAQVLKSARAYIFCGEHDDLEDAVRDAVKWVGHRLKLNLSQQDDLALAALEAAWSLEEVAA